MIADRIPREPRELIVARRPVELVLMEDSGAGLALILPPLEDLIEMRSLRDTQLSLKDLAAFSRDIVVHGLAGEFERLQSKRDRFADSPTYLMRLANLAELTGRRDVEFEFLKRAASVDKHIVFKHRLGDNLISREFGLEAKELFRTCNLETDIYANLRIAYFEVQERRFDEAKRIVERGLAIDPLHFGARLFHGALCLGMGKFEHAVQSFRVAQEERPNSSSLNTNMALAYLYLGQTEKAFSSLKLAVSFDPFNQNAVALLSDLAFSKQRNEDAVPALRYFLSLEQREAAMWARLARALLKLGDTNEAIAALKRQGSLEDTGAVWNNLGVAYTKADRGRALSAFNHAIKKGHGRDSILAARNLAFMLLELGSFDEAQALCEQVIKGNHGQPLQADRELSDLFVAYVVALERRGRIGDACKVCETVLKDPEAAVNLRAWLITALIANYSLDVGDTERIVELMDEAEQLIGSLPKEDRKRRDMLLNNLAFASAEIGLLDRAERYINPILQLIHKEPYPTATLGLMKIRRGQFERGVELYEEAVHLANNPRDKARVRQKLNLEKSLILLNDNPARAARLLKKVIGEKDGSSQLARRGRSLMETLPLRFQG